MTMSRQLTYHQDEDFDVDTILERVIVSSPTTLLELLDTIQALTEHHQIRLLIVDSLSFLGQFIDDALERTQMYFRIIDQLQDISVKLNIAVVVTTELSFRVIAKSEIDFVAAGGTLLSHRIHRRIMLTRLSDTHFAAHALKTPKIPKVSVKFQVDADGIKDVSS